MGMLMEQMMNLPHQKLEKQANKQKLDLLEF